MSTVRYPISPTLAAMKHDRHHVIEASAGTGKTYLIEHRVVDLIIAGATIDEILVVTFTEKATAELRARVRRVLELTSKSPRLAAEAADTTAASTPDNPAWIIDDPTRERLQEALVAFDRASIFTIHGFCQRVLTENAFANRRLFDQTQVASESAFGAAFKAVLRQELARDPDHQRYLRAWLGRKTGTDAVTQLQERLFSCASQHGEISPRFAEERLNSALRACATAWPEDASPTGPALAAACSARIHVSTQRSYAQRLQDIDDISKRYVVSNDMAAAIAEFDALLKKNSKWLVAVRKLLALDFGESEIAEALQGIGELISALVSLDAAVAQRFLPLINARLMRDKNRQGEFDFHDMLQLVWNALDDSGDTQHADDAQHAEDAQAARDLTNRLRKRYRHALIDEFQDTDELQWNIFRKLFLSTESGDSADPQVQRPGWLSIIGDPKQAIYSFRGADVFTYQRACREMMECGAQRTMLDTNYRSTPAMVDAYNLLFEDATADNTSETAEPFFGGGIVYSDPVRAGATITANDSVDSAPIHLVRPNDAPKNADALRRAHLAFIVAETQRILGDEQPLRVGSSDRPRAIRPGDIYVLTRSVNESNKTAEALRAVGVPCALYKQEGLFQTAEAEEVRDLLSAIVDPRNRGARKRAWNTRFFSTSLTEFSGMMRELDNASSARPHYSAENNPLVSALYSWKTIADELDYERLFAQILRDSHIVERELFAATSERALTNFLHLFDLLLEESHRSRCELGELVQRLQMWITEIGRGSNDERNIQRLESDPDAVQIMTVHKSKGLEAEVVFVYGGFVSGGRSDPGVYHRGTQRIVHVGSGAPVSVKQESQWEDQRLIYVAITRAISRLYLPWVDYAAMSRKPAPGMLKRVNERIDSLMEQRSCGACTPRLDVGFAVRDGTRTVAMTPATLSQDAGDAPDTAAPPPLWSPPERLLADPPANDELDRIARTRSGFSVTSYSRLSAATHRASPPVDRLDHEQGVDDARLELPENRLPGGTATGIYLHELLELVPLDSFARPPSDSHASPDDDMMNSWAAQPEIVELFQSIMETHAIAPLYANHSTELVYRALTHPIDLGEHRLEGLCRCTRVMREVEFLYPAPGDGTYVKGFIDVIFESGGRSYVLDWKSDRLGDFSRDALEVHVQQHYALQSGLYSLALEKMLRVVDSPDHERRFGGVVYCFLRGLQADRTSTVGLQFHRPSYNDLRAVEASITDLAASRMARARRGGNS